MRPALRKLESALEAALSGRSSSDRKWGKDFSDLAPELASIVWRNLSAIKQLQSDETSQAHRGAASRSVDIAEKLGRKAAQLVRLLHKHQPHISAAVANGYLPGSARTGRSLGDRLGAPEWEAGRRTTDALESMLFDVQEWNARARKEARGTPGPKLGTRIIDVDFVGRLLHRRGVPLTAGRAGYFARVLRVWYAAAGLSVVDVSRDIRRAFADKDASLPRRRR